MTRKGELKLLWWHFLNSKSDNRIDILREWFAHLEEIAREK